MRGQTSGKKHCLPKLRRVDYNYKVGHFPTRYSVNPSNFNPRQKHPPGKETDQSKALIKFNVLFLALVL